MEIINLKPAKSNLGGLFCKESRDNDMKYNNLWIDNYCDKLFSKELKSSKGKTFYSFWFPCDAIGGNFANVTISRGQRFIATRRNGSRMVGYSNVLLGPPDVMRKVTFRNDEGGYDSITLSVKQIVDSIEDERREYKARKRAEEKARNEISAKNEVSAKSIAWTPC